LPGHLGTTGRLRGDAPGSPRQALNAVRVR
jgi:hypothetical protein